ncbi:MAG TPA: hypothetical protein VFB45_15370 [Pseudolabrys sp.]|nr:hypothetical protein [Pseudolabrys sp.]
MSNRLGTPQSVIVAAAALGVTAGRAMSLGGAANQWVLVASMLFTYVASATAGSRVPVVQIKDPSGNILWSASMSTTAAANTTTRIALGGSVPLTAAATPATLFAPIPDGFSCPANSTVTVFDNADIDHAADTIAMNAVVSY